MNYRTMSVAIVGILCITAIIGAKFYTNMKMYEGRCELSLETQRELLNLACMASFEETLRNMDKEFCATWNADLELQKLDPDQPAKSKETK